MRGRIAAGCGALPGFSIWFRSYDYAALYVSIFNTPVRLGGLLQRIASIHGRFYPPGLNNLFEEDQIFSLFT